ncbi:MAG: AsmA-like C-terminal domain-containing protein, partial [Pseudomonadota bacterium]
QVAEREVRLEPPDPGQADGPATGIGRLEADLALSDLGLTLPDRFDEPVEIARAQAAFRLDPARQVVEIAALSLERGALTIAAAGRLALGPDGPRGAIRARATGATARDIKTLWPAGMAGNARRWVRANLGEGKVTEMVVQAALDGAAPPNLALDFTFEDADANAVDGMPRITGAAGVAQLRAEDMVLALARGQVATAPGLAVDLAGSSMRISEFSSPVTPGDIRLRASGPLAGVLEVIDRPPLRLLSRLGLPIDVRAGQADVTADLAFPLIAALPIEEVQARVDARLAGVEAVLPAPSDGTPTATARALRLTADTETLTLEGDVTLAGSTATLAWEERYGGRGGRSLRLTGTLAAETLAQMGVPAAHVEGAPGIDLRLEQAGDAPASLALDADLGPVRITPPGLTWDKPPGVPARLEARLTLAEPVRIERLMLDGGGASILATGSLSRTGRDSRFQVDRLVIGEALDLTGRFEQRDGALDVRLTGRRLDLGILRQREIDTADAATPGPLALAFDVSDLQLTPEIRVSPAAGRFNRGDNGVLAGSFAGRVSATAPLEGQLSLPPAGQGDGRLEIESADAGAFLRATSLAEEADGGTLSLDARLPDGDLERVEGLVVLRDVQLTADSTIERIVRAGEIDERVVSRSGGLSFEEVDLPFRYSDGILSVDNAIATGPQLAVRLSGIIDREESRIDMRGVASPAYALSGFLDDIPVLGRILTGNRGEGILGLTFSVSGNVDDPEISVNPLSILVPGILRDLFSVGKTGDTVQVDGEGPPRRHLLPDVADR